MQRLEPDVDKILASYKVYMEADGGKAVSAKEVMLNLEKKMNDSTFLGDMTALLKPKTKYDPYEAFEYVKKELIERISPTY